MVLYDLTAATVLTVK